MVGPPQVGQRSYGSFRMNDLYENRTSAKINVNVSADVRIEGVYGLQKLTEEPPEPQQCVVSFSVTQLLVMRLFKMTHATY